MLADGAADRGEILPDDIAQCVTDIDSKLSTLAEGPTLNPGAPPDALAAVSTPLIPLVYQSKHKALPQHRPSRDV
jgi:hypothetical protein